MTRNVRASVLPADKSLNAYRAKRDFAKTPEPSGASEPTTGDIFVVQKHAAGRMHYDLRLELDGVLLSWAVTRGPSNNPDDKRLAVRTEDHPLDYAQFEGTIPKREYGGGTVMLWDRGTWETISGKNPRKTLPEGHLHFILHGARMTGAWILVRLKPRNGEQGENWLLRKVADSHAGASDDLVSENLSSIASGRMMDEIAAGKAARSTLPSTERAEKVPDPESVMAQSKPGTKLPPFQRVQLATLADHVPAGDQWLHEIKYDGYRTLISVAGSAGRAYTRSGLDWSERYAGLIADAVALNVQSALIDGEAVVVLPDGRTSFAALQATLSDNSTTIVYFAFDLLELNGEDLTGRPLTARKEALSELIGSGSGNLRYSDHIAGHGEQLFDRFCAAGLEGVISKRSASRYTGTRSSNWLKIKCVRREAFVVLGWLPSEKGRGFKSLLLGVEEEGRMRFAGKVGTGFSDAEMARLLGTMAPLRQDVAPVEAPAAAVRGACWIKPSLVVDVAFTDFTGSGVLRHSSYLGLRNDIKSADVAREVAMNVPVVSVPTASGVKISNRGRVIFPEGRMTKGQLADYYETVAGIMLPFAGNRPISLVRCPQGRDKKCFFQRHDSGSFGDDVKQLAIRDLDGETEPYIFVDSTAGLLGCVQMGTIEFHGWGAGVADIERPDRLVLDLDPDEGLGFAAVVAAAFDIREILSMMGLVSFALTTGGKGVHVVVPLTPGAEWPEVKDFARRLALALAQSRPEKFTASLAKAKRKGRIFIDYLRNQRGATAILPYSARARAFAPIAVPVTWEELRSLQTAANWQIGDGAEMVGRATSAELARWGQAVQVLPDR